MFLSAVASAQTTQPSAEISPGFKLRPVGVIDIGDAYAEVNYYDSKWTIAQQHDKFVPGKAAPATQPSVHEISGVLTTAAGPAKYSERVEAIDGGIKYSAELSSEKPLDTNELSMAFILPLDTFGGKQIVVDAQSQKLSKDAPAKGSAMILQKDDAHEVDVTTPRGTLAISGDFKFLIQDDREWGDPRYSMRLFFTPGSGQIKDSKIELIMKWKPSGS
ncbi:MAG TPA: hypothetical protein VGF52_01265 [Tepidisphaeraceae bacterium]